MAENNDSNYFQRLKFIIGVRNSSKSFSRKTNVIDGNFSQKKEASVLI
jgi:hypothetical protein